MTSIIFTPVGVPIQYHPTEYDRDSHWRLKKSERLYETFVCLYNDFLVEDDSYDYIIHDTGFKWDLAFRFLNTIDYTKYEYIGFFDDDLITDIQSINYALELAKAENMKLFQLSTLDGSEHQHRILWQDKALKFSRTNFIEGMGPFFHRSVIPTLLDFWKFHAPKSGWGFDILFSPITKERAGVVHQVSMFHPPSTFPGYKKSYYDKSMAFAEMDHILSDVYPKFMKYKYNEVHGPYVTPQTIYEISPRTQ